jgi:hypothetical protein
MIIGKVQFWTYLGIFLQIMGSLKTVPPSSFLIVPLGDFHIFFKLNSLTLKNKIYNKSINKSFNKLN